MNHHVRERAIFVETSHALIRRLEEAIDALIAMRDSLEGDSDAEPTLGAPELFDEYDLEYPWARGATDDGEAEIGMPNAIDQGGKAFERGYPWPDDAEDGHDAEEDKADEEPAGDEDEPTLGAPERAGPWDRYAWARGARQDGEAEITVPTLAPDLSQDARYRPAGYNTPDDCEAVGDDEPTLGEPEIFTQRAWGMSEREHEDLELDDDEEPDLGAPERLDQGAWGMARRKNLDDIM